MSLLLWTHSTLAAKNFVCKQENVELCCVWPAGVVKMRRGQVATFMLQVQSMKEVYQIFHQFATTITLKYALSTLFLHCEHSVVMVKWWCQTIARHRKMSRTYNTHLA